MSCSSTTQWSHLSYQHAVTLAVAHRPSHVAELGLAPTVCELLNNIEKYHNYRGSQQKQIGYCNHRVVGCRQTEETVVMYCVFC